MSIDIASHLDFIKNLKPVLDFTETNPPSAKLLCVACKDSFSNPWDLMVHAQAAHMVNIYELGDSSDEDKASSMSSDSLADPSVTESSSSKRLTNGSDKSAETNGVHPEEARDHHVKDKSPEENKVSDREISACKQINRDRKILKCLFTGSGTSSYLRSHAPGNTEQPFFFFWDWNRCCC